MKFLICEKGKFFMGGFNMLIKRTRQIKRILIAFFLGCLFLLCSCQKEKGYSITFENNGHLIVD